MSGTLVSKHPRRVVEAWVRALLAWLALADVAQAQVPVIEPGREAQVLALFAPYALGTDVQPGVRFSGISIDRSSITATVTSSDGTAQLVLLHPRSPNAPSRRTVSFALRVQGNGDPRAAAGLLADAVSQNDQTPFWRVVADTSGASQVGPVAPTLDGLSVDLALLALLLGLIFLALRARDQRSDGLPPDADPGSPSNPDADPGSSPTDADPGSSPNPGSPSADADPGSSPNPGSPSVPPNPGSPPDPGSPSVPVTVWALVAITLLALVLRVWLAPDTLLGAWPYSRQVYLQDALFQGPTLAWASHHWGLVMTRHVVTSVDTLALSVATPAAMFVLVHALLEDRRTALASAFVLSVLPLHIRFARSEVALVASLLLGALFLAQVRAVVRARTSLGATLGLVCVALLAPLALSTRPLDLLLAPLALGALLWLPSYRGPTHRRVVVAVVVTVIAAMVLVDHTLAHFGEQVSEGLHERVLLDAIASVATSHNTLLNAQITSPAFGALAVLGLLALLRTNRVLALGFAGWLAAAFVAHAYVVPESVSMQARYHLHLVLPFVALVAAGGVAAVRRFPRAAWPLAALLLVSPLLARGFIEDTRFDPLAEFAFVQCAAAQIPDGSTVLEFNGGHGVRFGRLFDRLDDGVVGPRFHVITVDPTDDSQTLSTAAQEALSSGSNLYIYEGLPCLGLPRQPPPTTCAELLRTAHAETLMEEQPAHRVYDENLAPNLAPGQPVPLRLYRVRSTSPTSVR